MGLALSGSSNLHRTAVAVSHIEALWHLYSMPAACPTWLAHASCLHFTDFSVPGTALA
jgi:hypothetical protein